MRREELNAQARVHAIGWAGLFNGFKGSNDPPIDFVSLLPFPEDILSQEDSGVSDRTKSIIKDIIKAKKLPVSVGALLAGLL